MEQVCEGARIDGNQVTPRIKNLMGLIGYAKYEILVFNDLMTSRL